METTMKTTRLLSMLMLLLTSFSPAVAGPASNGCRAAYARNPYFVDKATRYTYFQDTVADVSVDADGNTWIGFELMAKRVKLGTGDWMPLLQRSLDAQLPVHVMIDDTDKSLVPHDTLEADLVQYVDFSVQHSSCN
jgi:hypothetical protein